MGSEEGSDVLWVVKDQLFEELFELQQPNVPGEICFRVEHGEFIDSEVVSDVICQFSVGVIDNESVRGVVIEEGLVNLAEILFTDGFSESRFNL